MPRRLKATLLRGEDIAGVDIYVKPVGSCYLVSVENTELIRNAPLRKGIVRIILIKEK